jgi:hypothetical protein
VIRHPVSPENRERRYAGKPEIEKVAIKLAECAERRQTFVKPRASRIQTQNHRRAVVPALLKQRR